MENQKNIDERSYYGSITYYNQILRDLAEEPTEQCEWNKRRKCDSYYISMYNKLLKEYHKLLEDYTNSQLELIELQNQVKGGEKDVSTKGNRFTR